jgi:hypothetical protein
VRLLFFVHVLTTPFFFFAISLDRCIIPTFYNFCQRTWSRPICVSLWSTCPRGPSTRYCTTSRFPLS